MLCYAMCFCVKKGDGSALRILVISTPRGRADGLMYGIVMQSIPQTRLRFQKEMIGLIDEFGSEEWKDEVEVAEEDKYPKDRKYGRVTKGESGDLSRGRKGLSGRD